MDIINTVILIAGFCIIPAGVLCSAADSLG